MMSDLSPVWAVLRHQPLWGLLATLLAYRAGLAANRAMRGNVLAHPVLIAVVILVAFLAATGIPYRDYFAGAQYVHFLLGPATVALAIPMFRSLHHIRRTARALVPALASGSIVSAGRSAMPRGGVRDARKCATRSAISSLRSRRAGTSTAP